MRVLTWNGKTFPPELRKLPPGRYAVESLEDLPQLTAEEDAAVQAGLDSLERGEGIPAEEVHAGLRAMLRKRTSPRKRRK